MSKERLKKELDLFQKFILQSKNENIEKIDSHGLVFRSDKKNFGKRIHFLVTGLVHGNEVIGLEVMNRMINKIQEENIKFMFDIGFLLCNIEAALLDQRFIESDLNRSFGVLEAKTIEHKRAIEISKILVLSDHIFDLHQTVEPTLTPFFVVEKNYELVNLAFQVLPEYPIVTFDAGSFSRSGQTLMEYSNKNGSKALVLECGQKGFSNELSQIIEEACFQFINILEKQNIVKNSKIKTYHISESVLSDEQTHLRPNLKSFTEIKKGDVIAIRNQTEIKALFDGMLIFPSYGEKARTNHELCNLCRIQYLKYKD